MENTHSKLILKNITPDQRKGVIAGTIAVASLLGGAALFGFRSKNNIVEENSEVASVNTSGENSELILVDTSAKFYNENMDNMPFGDAFDAARENLGSGGFFNWNGSTYNTYYKEEWDGLNNEQQSSYLTNVEESISIQEFKNKIIELEEQQSQLITENQSLNERVTELENKAPIFDDVQDPGQNSDGDITDPTQNEGEDPILPFSSQREFAPEYKLLNDQIEINHELGDVSDFKDEDLVTDFESDRDVSLMDIDETSEITEAMDIQEIEGMIEGDVVEAINIDEIESTEPIEPLEFEDTQDIFTGDVTPTDFSEDIPNLF